MNEVRSMTGFARVRRELPEGELIVSLKSVNHRGLDVHFHLPAYLDAFETTIRSAIKRQLTRGHVQVHVTFTNAASGHATGLNKELLQAWLDAFSEARRKSSLATEPDLNVAMRIPGMFQAETAVELPPDFESHVTGATEEALAMLNDFREKEGEAIAAELHERCTGIGALVGRMEKIRAKATAAFQKRLKDRLAELLRGAAIEPQRLVQEAAILADRSDISEELIRLKTHAGQLEELLDKAGEKGKKLDFLLQEMNREANTILSKTGGLGDIGLTITDLALAAKAEIDKIREQALNIE